MQLSDIIILLLARWPDQITAIIAFYQGVKSALTAEQQGVIDQNIYNLQNPAPPPPE